MFRLFPSQNLTRLCKPSRYFVRKWLRRYSVGCPCPSGPEFRKAEESGDNSVTICGAGGQVGSIIAFLLKQSPFIDILKLYDLDCTYGIAMDISHIDTKCKVQAYSKCRDLHAAMNDSRIILICAGVGRAPGMHLNDLFEYNAPVVKQIVEAIIQVNPKAFIAILTNPVNSLVPMVSEMFKTANSYDPRKIFGITTVDSMRASTIVTNEVFKGTEDPAEFLVPVIGGHSPDTMIPVLSQITPCIAIPNTSFEFLVNKIRHAADQVTMVKEIGGPRLSVALAASRFINNLIRGANNEKDVMEMAYVSTNSVPGVTYFSVPVELGPSGVKQSFGLLKVNEEYEKPILRKAINCLRCDIQKGENFVRGKKEPHSAKAL